MIRLWNMSNKYITFVLVKSSELFRLLKKEGWYVVRQRGSHHIMRHREKDKELSVPIHAGKEMKIGMLKYILKEAGINNFKKR